MGPGGVSPLSARVPPPADLAMERATVERAVEAAMTAAFTEEMQGPAVTPFLLAELVKATEGESLAVNLALLANNAKLAAEIAVQSPRSKVQGQPQHT
jgi:pseudouridine-5'-phosphate glycosidase